MFPTLQSLDLHLTTCVCLAGKWGSPPLPSVPRPARSSPADGTVSVAPHGLWAAVTDALVWALLSRSGTWPTRLGREGGRKEGREREERKAVNSKIFPQNYLEHYLQTHGSNMEAILIFLAYILVLSYPHINFAFIAEELQSFHTWGCVFSS